jgi:hypothetical protein
MPVSDSAFCQVVRRQFERNTIASHYLDPVAAEFPGHGREHRLTCVEFDGKHSGSEFLNNLAHDFNCIFFWQIFLQSFGFCLFKNLGGTLAAALTGLAKLPAVVVASAVAVSTAGRSAFRFRTGFIDVERPAVEVSTVQSADGGVSFGIDAHFDEREASGLSGVAIRDDVDALNGSV